LTPGRRAGNFQGLDVLCPYLLSSRLCRDLLSLRLYGAGDARVRRL
jgi:hypothetical protein